jgi:hypothetical protein
MAKVTVKTHESAVGALVPLLVASVAVAVVVASASSCVRENFVRSLPVVAGAPGSAADGRGLPVGDAGGRAVKVGVGTVRSINS